MYALRSVTKTYSTAHGTVTALDDITMDIEEGEWVAIQGATGGGKSTLLQLLGALDRPTTGEVTFGTAGDGLRFDALADRMLATVRANRIGFIFQGFNLIPTLSARDNVVAALRPLGVGREEANERAIAALTRVGLADRATHLPAALSGGQQQRVAVARALVKNPNVILADEPTGNLDERMRDEIVDLFARVREESGVTLVIVTHDSHVARRAGRMLTLDSGRIVEPSRS